MEEKLFEVSDGVRIQYWGNEKNVVIPEGVSEISDRAFLDRTSIESATIPGSVTSIGKGAFSNCTSLKEIRYGGTKAQWMFMLGGFNLVSPVRVAVSCSDGDARSVRSDLLRRRKMTEIALPGNIVKIASRAFAGCESLASVKIPGSVVMICSEAFKGCKNLTSVTGDRLCRTCARHSEGCTDVMPASIPGSVKYIGYEAFAGCTSLTSFNISEGVRSIGRGAFARCTSLTDVSIPSSVTEIGTGTFADCTSLKEIRYGGTKAQWASVQRGVFWCTLSVESILCTDGKSEDVGSNCDKDGMYFRLGA